MIKIIFLLTLFCNSIFAERIDCNNNNYIPKNSQVDYTDRYKTYLFKNKEFEFINCKFNRYKLGIESSKITFENCDINGINTYDTDLKIKSGTIGDSYTRR